MKKGSGKKSRAKLRSRARKGGATPRSRTGYGQRRPVGIKRIPANAVFLVGFMGAGKSSVGRMLGQQLNWIFEDLDDRIQAREGRTIPQIFRDSGESAFRRAENAALREVLEELQAGVARIIALGGGAFVQKENATLLAASGCPTVFLDAPVEELWQRCCSQSAETETDRPLLRSFEEFHKLYHSRHGGYAKASLRVQTAGRPIEAVAADVAELLRLKKIAVRTEQGEVE